MTEAFLHYLWQHRLFDMKNLRSDTGAVVEVVRPGMYNTGSGPDFFNAQLRLDGILWAGNVEVHIRSSDWSRHRHHADPAYDNCILHVVHEYDAPTLSTSGSVIPVVSLKNKFPLYLWENYLYLIGTRGWISCQHRIGEIDEHTWRKVSAEMIEERIEQKSTAVLIALKGNQGDWEETFYQHLSRNFGFQLNALPFEMLSRKLPLKYIRKESHELLNVEALFFGQAGMLAQFFKDEYPQRLKDTYHHLTKKYSLQAIPVSAWKFLRLRPVNFPTIRLAQLSKLLSGRSSLFNLAIETESLQKLQRLFESETSEYWNTHYVFERKAGFTLKRMGKTSINNILINTIIPFLYAWGKYTGNKGAMERAFKFMAELPAEENHILSKWKELGITVRNSIDSQSLIQLYTQHCSEKKCLTCSIGNRLINSLP